MYIMSDKRELENGNRGMYRDNAEVFDGKLFSERVDNAREFLNSGDLCLKKEYVLYKPKVSFCCLFVGKVF